MTIKQQGGIFGRNPTFNNVDVDGTLSVNQIVEKTAASGISLDGVTLKDGNVVLLDGKGIDFSATSGTGTSELFDDYEEGVFTATFGGSTSEATYTKIGRQVFCDILVNANSESFSSITGLPFTSATGGYTGGFWGRSLRADILDANGVPCRASVAGTTVNFTTNVAGGADGAFTVTTAASGAVRLGLTVIYYV